MTVDEAYAAAAPELGVVIVSFNTRDVLAECLDALHVALSQADFVASDDRDPNPSSQSSSASPHAPLACTWVVDNGSKDGSADMVERAHPWVRLVQAGANLGFTAANNRILEPWIRRGDCPRYVLLLNPDAVLDANAITILRAAMDALPRAAAVGPSLRYADGRFQHAAFRFPGLVQTALDLWPIPRLQDSRWNGRYSMQMYEGGEPFRVDTILGACMFIRGAALEEIGRLDEGYFMYCEELDWCRRAERAGWDVYCAPLAGAVHYAGASSGQFREHSFLHLWRSRLRYAERHLPPWRRRAVRAMLQLGLTQRARLERAEVEAGALSEPDRIRRAAAYRSLLRDSVPPRSAP